MNYRDDFSQKTKHLIANRAGVRCSNPTCRKPTSGANSNPDKITNIGVAAHICAASEGGPRYDSTMTANQRKSSKNGIWLCQSCSKLIDSDTTRYTVDVLRGWKRLAEALSTFELEKPSILKEGVSESSPHLLENLDGHWFAKRSEKNPIRWGYPSIDELYKLSPGAVVLIAGYSNTDISILAQNISRLNVKAHNSIIYFNLKESSNSIVNSLLAAEGYVETERIRTGRLREDEWERISYASALLTDGNLLFESYDVSQSMHKKFLSAIKYGHADLVVLDDLGGLDIEEREFSSFLYQLRCVASESNTTVLILYDIPNIPSRVDKRPVVSDPPIRELSKFCDVIQFLYRDELCSCGKSSDSFEFELITAKYYTSFGSTTFYVKELPHLATMLEYEKVNGSPRDISEKYPGLIAGAKALVESLSNY